MTRPEAREITGTFLEISGLTVPVTFSSEVAVWGTALVSWNRSGRSTSKRLRSSALWTFRAGGASACGLLGGCLQADSSRPTAKHKMSVPNLGHLIAEPRVPPQDSIGWQR